MVECRLKPSLKWPSNMLTPHNHQHGSENRCLFRQGGEWPVAILGYEEVKGQHVFGSGSLYPLAFHYSHCPVTLLGSENLFKVSLAYLYHKRKSVWKDPAFVPMFPYF